MPNWDSGELKGIKNFIIKYITALNMKDFQILQECFAVNAILHRGMKNYVGRDEIIVWYKNQLKGLKFELKDASAGLLPDSSAKCILWFEICAKGYDKIKKDVHIESIDLEKAHSSWEIQKCFGLGYDPEYHKKYFSKFLE